MPWPTAKAEAGRDAAVVAYYSRVFRNLRTVTGFPGAAETRTSHWAGDRPVAPTSRDRMTGVSLTIPVPCFLMEMVGIGSSTMPPASLCGILGDRIPLPRARRARRKQLDDLRDLRDLRG